MMGTPGRLEDRKQVTYGRRNVTCTHSAGRAQVEIAMSGQHAKPAFAAR